MKNFTMISSSNSNSNLFQSISTFTNPLQTWPLAFSSKTAQHTLTLKKKQNPSYPLTQNKKKTVCLNTTSVSELVPSKLLSPQKKIIQGYTLFLQLNLTIQRCSHWHVSHATPLELRWEHLSQVQIQLDCHELKAVLHTFST